MEKLCEFESMTICELLDCYATGKLHGGDLKYIRYYAKSEFTVTAMGMIKEEKDDEIPLISVTDIEKFRQNMENSGIFKGVRTIIIAYKYAVHSCDKKLMELLENRYEKINLHVKKAEKEHELAAEKSAIFPITLSIEVDGKEWKKYTILKKDISDKKSKDISEINLAAMSYIARVIEKKSQNEKSSPQSPYKCDEEIKKTEKKGGIIDEKKGGIIDEKKGETINEKTTTIPEKEKIDEAIVCDEELNKRKKNPEEKKYSRKGIPKQLRDMTWEKYYNTIHAVCLCCGITKISVFDFDCSHILSIKNGGETNIKNLVPLCACCNRSMGAENVRDYMKKYHSRDFDQIISKERIDEQSCETSENIEKKMDNCIEKIVDSIEKKMADPIEKKINEVLTKFFSKLSFNVPIK